MAGFAGGDGGFEGMSAVFAQMTVFAAQSSRHMCGIVSSLELSLVAVRADQLVIIQHFLLLGMRLVAGGTAKGDLSMTAGYPFLGFFRMAGIAGERLAFNRIRQFGMGAFATCQTMTAFAVNRHGTMLADAPQVKMIFMAGLCRYQQIERALLPLLPGLG